MKRRIAIFLALSSSWLSAQYTITTFAGGGSLNNVPATSTGIGDVTSVAADAFGNVYVASSSQNRVYKVNAAGMLTVVAGNGGAGYSGDGGPALAATLNQPYGIAVEPFGAVFIADSGNCRIRRVSGGVITTVAGVGPAINGSCPSTGDGGPATSASLIPYGLALDASGALYATDTYRVRRVKDGMIATVAGNGTFGTALDGTPATSASITTPRNLALDRFGRLYIADSLNFRVWVVENGIIRTFVPLRIDLLVGLATDADGNVYYSNYTGIYRVTNGVVTKVAGNGDSSFSGDGGGALDAGMLPVGIFVDDSGNIDIADDANKRLRQVSQGYIQTIAGNGSDSYGGEEGFPPTAINLSKPADVVVDRAGNVFINDVGNRRIRKIANNSVSTVAMPNADCAPYCGRAMAIDSFDRIYFIDGLLVRMLVNGNVQTVAGNGSRISSGDGGPATSAGMSPHAIAATGDGDLFIIDDTRLRKVSHGIITTLISGLGLAEVAVDGLGNIYVLDSYVLKKVTNGVITTLQAPSLGSHISASSLGNLYLLTLGGGGDLSRTHHRGRRSAWVCGRWRAGHRRRSEPTVSHGG